MYTTNDQILFTFKSQPTKAILIDVMWGKETFNIKSSSIKKQLIQ
jgi:hypothetical protein